MIVGTTDSDFDIALSGSEDEEDAVEEGLDYGTDSVYEVSDTCDHGQPENTDDGHSETGDSTVEKTTVFQGKDLTWTRTAPIVARARRENIIVRVPVCVNEAKNVCKVQRATRRWTLAIFYGIVKIAAVNALVIYAHNMRNVQPEKKIKRKQFCSELHMIW
jgi:hypothetical protein